MAIGALPHEAFLGVAASLFEAVKADDSAWNNYPMIYVRVGEAGVTMLPFYRDQFFSDRIKGWWRVLPVLALCRIGAADTELIEELKRRYVAVDLHDGGQHDNYKAALFVTLLKLWAGAVSRNEPPREFPAGCMGNLSLYDEALEDQMRCHAKTVAAECAWLAARS